MANQKKIDLSKYKFSLGASRQSTKNGFNIQKLDNSKSTTESTLSVSNRKEIKTSLNSSFNKENVITSTSCDTQSQIQAQSPVINNK
jgi:hypothetical protein